MNSLARNRRLILEVPLSGRNRTTNSTVFVRVAWPGGPAGEDGDFSGWAPLRGDATPARYDAGGLTSAQLRSIDTHLLEIMKSVRIVAIEGKPD